jgi:succinate-semialdehyde dehydrogenase/glutarate-semialdehyde dehydrogenase
MKEVFFSIDPSTNEKRGEFVRHEAAEIDECLEKLKKTFESWRLASLEDRKRVLFSLERSLIDQKESLAQLITQEMGKPILQSIAEIEKSALVCRFYAENAENFLEPRQATASARVHLEPLGTLLLIMPWNFPFWQVFRVLAPNLILGNVCLLKHASNVPRCALAIEKMFLDYEFDGPLLANLFLHPSQVEKLIADPRIDAVTLTGSLGAGRQVAAAAGRNLKKVVLELGGSDPYVIFEDAEISSAAEICAQSRLLNTGQSCVSAKRFIVLDKVHDEFVEKLQEAMFSFRQGQPLNPETQLGPLAKPEFCEDLEAQVHQSLAQGAHLVRNEKTNRDSAFYPTTLLTNVKKGMRVYEEEVFGPVAAVIKAKTEEEAVRFANDTPFGLGAALFTKNREKALRIAQKEIQAGMVCINDFVRSDPRFEFGGIKLSGFGRELGLVGLQEFANIKAVVFDQSLFDKF